MLTRKTKDSYSQIVMPKFDKEISQPGQYYASTPGGKGRTVITITPERQQGWIDQFYRMKQAGLKIPAPFVHRQDAAGMPLTEEELKNITSKDNGGFWEDFWIDKATNKLMGRVDVPLAEDAERIGKTITEVSPLFLSDHTDGKGRRWDKEALMHVAFVNHAVDSDQNNFIPNEQGASLGLALHKGGFQMADDATGVATVPPQVPAAPAVVVPNVGEDFSTAVRILQELGFQLPADTTPENFVSRLVATGGQMIADKKKADPDDQSTTEPPAGAQAQPSPVALAQNQQLMSIATTSIRQGHVNRINALVQKGSIPQKFAEEKLMPMVNGFQLSLNPLGQPEATPLDTILLTLEAAPTLATPITGLLPDAAGAQFGMNDQGKFAPVIQENPTEGNLLEGEEFEKLVNSQISQAGLKPSPWSQ